MSKNVIKRALGTQTMCVKVHFWKTIRHGSKNFYCTPPQIKYPPWGPCTADLIMYPPPVLYTLTRNLRRRYDQKLTSPPSKFCAPGARWGERCKKQVFAFLKLFFACVRGPSRLSKFTILRSPGVLDPCVCLRAKYFVPFRENPKKPGWPEFCSTFGTAQPFYTMASQPLGVKTL